MRCKAKVGMMFIYGQAQHCIDIVAKNFIRTLRLGGDGEVLRTIVWHPWLVNEILNNQNYYL